MDISKRIENLGDIFELFNVAEGIAYVLIKMQEKWIIPDLSEYKVIYSLDNKKGYYFYTELENGTECLFDAIDATVAYNKSLIEKMKLFTIKAEELKELFAEESLEKLKTLTFEFKEGNPVGNILPDIIKKTTKPKKDKKGEKKVEEVTVEVPNEAKEKNEENNDSSMMNLVKDLVDE